MLLSLWQCQALFVIAQSSLRDIADLSQIDYGVVHNSALCDGWEEKRRKYLGLPPEAKKSHPVIELILGDFVSDKSRNSYVRYLLSDDFSASSGVPASAERAIARLREFGIEEADAKCLISDIESIMGLERPNPKYPSSVSLPERLDTINSTYRYLAQAHDRNASFFHDDLRKKIQFFSLMLDRLQETMPDDLSFEQIAQAQRNIRYCANAYGSLVHLYFEIAGLKGYINHQSAIAKVFGQGYMVIKRDEMGRLVDASLDAPLLPDA